MQEYRPTIGDLDSERFFRGMPQSKLQRRRPVGESWFPLHWTRLPWVLLILTLASCQLPSGEGRTVTGDVHGALFAAQKIMDKHIDSVGRENSPEYLAVWIATTANLSGCSDFSYYIRKAVRNQAGKDVTHYLVTDRTLSESRVLRGLLPNQVQVWVTELPLPADQLILAVTGSDRSARQTAPNYLSLSSLRSNEQPASSLQEILSLLRSAHSIAGKSPVEHPQRPARAPHLVRIP